MSPLPGWGIDHVNPVADHPLNRGRVAWWLATPGSSGGPKWYDCLGRNHGTLTNMSAAGLGWQSTSRSGGSRQVNFNGSSTYVAVGGSWPLTSSTWLVWANLASANQNVGLVFGSAALIVSGRGERRLTLSWAGQPATYLWEGGPQISLNRWVMLAAVQTPTAITCYQFDNGVVTSGVNSVTCYPITLTNVDLGRDNNFDSANRSVLGAFDDGGLWNRPLSLVELSAYYQESSQGNPNTLNRVRPSVFLLGSGTAAANTGTAAATLGRLGGYSVASQALAATGSPILARVAGSATAIQAVPTTAVATLTRVTSQATGASVIQGTAVASLARLTGSGLLVTSQAGTGQAALGRMLGSAVGQTRIAAAGSGSLGRVVGYGVGSAIVLPTNNGVGSGVLGRLIGSGIGYLFVDPPIFENELQAWLEERLDQVVYRGLIDEGDTIGDDRSAVVLTMVGSDSPLKLDGPAGASYWRVQLDCHSTAPSQAARDVERLRLLLQSYRGWVGRCWVKNAVLIGRPGGFDPRGQGQAGGTARRMIEFRFCVRESVPT